jgi:hypothetical protein
MVKKYNNLLMSKFYFQSITGTFSCKGTELVCSADLFTPVFKPLILVKQTFLMQKQLLLHA